jgi:Gpi18-like mannosyltransferase
MLCSKYSLATVFYGIAFSFKIQAIFVLPLFAVIVPFLLPRMHERYFFLADILSILYVFYFPSRFYTAIIMSLVSLFAYFPFLFGQTYISMFKLSCIMLINVIIILYHFFNKVIINYRKPNLFSN